jgi:hypothetical protein
VGATAGAGILAACLGVASMSQLAARDPRPPAPPEATAPPSVAPKIAPAEAGAPSAATAPSATATRRMTVEANAPIAVLRVGGRSIRPARPGTKVDVELAPGEAGELRLEVVASDGRVAWQTVSAGASTVEIRFAAAAPGRKAPSEVPLADNPYGPR